jgi:hypothetical protein
MLSRGARSWSGRSKGASKQPSLAQCSTEAQDLDSSASVSNTSKGRKWIGVPQRSGGDYCLLKHEGYRFLLQPLKTDVSKSCVALSKSAQCVLSNLPRPCCHQNAY